MVGMDYYTYLGASSGDYYNILGFTQDFHDEFALPHNLSFWLVRGFSAPMPGSSEPSSSLIFCLFLAFLLSRRTTNDRLRRGRGQTRLRSTCSG